MSDDRRTCYASTGRPKKWPKPTEPEPTMDQLEWGTFDSGVEATDGCLVEPDGWCEHGHPSWLLKLGFV